MKKNIRFGKGMPKTILEEKREVEVEAGVTINAVIGYDDASSAENIVFIFPPHPSLGGDYDNNVVTALHAGFARAGHVAVRFNYRGVDTGKVHDEHLFAYWERLESAQEYALIVQDTAKVITEIRNALRSEARIHFVAYSFGNVIAFELMDMIGAEKLFGISPPIEAYDIEPYLAKKRTYAFAVAAEDMFCNKERMGAYAHTYGFPLTIINTDDHFFRGAEEQLLNAAHHAVGI